MTFVFSFCDCYCAKVASAHVATQTSRTSSQVVGNIEKGETPATRHEETSHMALKGSQQALKKQPKSFQKQPQGFHMLNSNPLSFSRRPEGQRYQSHNFAIWQIMVCHAALDACSIYKNTLLQPLPSC